MTPNRSRLAAIGLTLCLLLAGAFVGVGIDRLWIRDDTVVEAPRARRAPERQLERFRRRLELTDSQATAIGEILRDAQREIREHQERSRAARERSRAAIMALLTPEQAAKYEQMIERAQRRRGGRRGRAPR